MKRVAKAAVTVREFADNLSYLIDEPVERVHPLLIATAEEVMARLDAKFLRLAYAAFQYGYVLAQVEAAAKWGESHRKVDRETLKQRKREAVAQVTQMKEAPIKRTYKYIQEVVAEDLGYSSRTIRRWRKELGK